MHDDRESEPSELRHCGLGEVVLYWQPIRILTLFAHLLVTHVLEHGGPESKPITPCPDDFNAKSP